MVAVMPHPSSSRIRHRDRASRDGTRLCTDPVASRRDIAMVRHRKTRSGRRPGCWFSSRRSSLVTFLEGGAGEPERIFPIVSVSLAERPRSFARMIRMLIAS